MNQFDQKLARHNLHLRRSGLRTLQISIGRKCFQSNAGMQLRNGRPLYLWDNRTGRFGESRNPNWFSLSGLRRRRRQQLHRGRPLIFFMAKKIK